MQKLRRENRSANVRATVYLTRILVNCFVLSLLAGATFLVYFTTDKLLQASEIGIKGTENIERFFANVAETLILFWLPTLKQVYSHLYSRNLSQLPLKSP